jgi:hypothetical protein
MDMLAGLFRRLLLIGSALTAFTAFAAAQPDPEKPVTPPDSYRVVMENERMRMIEIHIKAHSKVNVDSPAARDRFLYMLSDGALILAPPGKTPYEFALHAGETAVFPAVSPTVENDTDSAVRALMVEIKTPMRTVAVSKAKGKARYAARGKARGKVSGQARGRSKAVAVRSAATRTAAKSAAPSAAPKPLNLSKANARPAKKLSGKSKGSSS